MKTRKLLLGLFFGILWQVGYSQIDTQFWFVAPEVSKNDYQRFDEPIVMRLTTLNAPASITISIPAEPSFIPLHIAARADTSVSVDLSPWLELLENKPANTILNKGILINSTAPITAYYDVVSSYCNCNPELYSLKGTNALGKEFLLPGQTQFDNAPGYSPTPYNAFDIVATENNTTVTITPAKDIVGHSEGQAFQIVLNKGQTWSGVATGQSVQSHLHGTSIIADKPVAITLSDDLLDGIIACADLVGDQVVPINMAGNEYIGIRGFLTNDGDRLFVLGLVNNTNLYFDGSTVTTTINRGEVHNHLIQNNSTHLSSSAPVLVYQTSGYGCELGSAVLPQIQCTGSESVSIFRSYDSHFGLLLCTEMGNETGFLINGDSTIVVASDFLEVPGTNGHWLAARVVLSIAQVPAGTTCKVSNRNGVFHLGLISGGSDDGCSYGYFSNFNSLELGPNLTVCADDTAILDAGFGLEPYLWSTGDTTRTIAVTTAGSYWVQAGHGSCLLSDTIYVSFQPYPVVNLGPDTLFPCGVLSGTLSTLPGYANYQWNIPGDSNTLEVTTSGTYWCRVTDSIGCVGSDTVSVTIRPLPVNLNQGTGGFNLIEGLVAYYPFNGNANDESGNGNDGVVDGATLTEDRFGNQNSAYGFDGIDDFIKADDSPSLNIVKSLSIVAWFKTDDPDIVEDGEIACLLGKHSTFWCRSFGIHMSDSTGFNQYSYDSLHLVLFPFDNSEHFMVIPSHSLYNSNWHQIVVTYDYPKGLGITYIDGQLIKSSNMGQLDLMQTPEPLLVACYGTYVCASDLKRGFFHGLIDDIRIYNRALTPEEVTCLYSGDCTGGLLSAELTNNSICENESTNIHIINSQLGISYQLIKEQTNFGNAQVGDGDILNFPITGLSQTTVFTILATDTATGCFITLDTTLVVNVFAIDAVVTSDTAICAGSSVLLSASGGDSYLWSNGMTTPEITVLPEGTTTYTVNISNDYGCSEDHNVRVTVHSLPLDIGQSTGTGNSINEGLVAYYPFNGNANDESGNGNDGEIIGDVLLTTDRFGIPSKAYSFPGLAFNYISVLHSQSLSLDTMTLNAWIFTDTDYGYGYIIQKNRDIQSGHYGLYTAGVLGLVSYGVGVEAFVATPPDSGSWHMVTGVLFGNTARFYVDGLLIADTIANEVFVYTGSQSLAIGMHYYDGVPEYYTYPYKGKIDDIRIYNRALSPEEVSALYTGGNITGNLAVSLTSATICAGSSTTINLYNSQPDIEYQLLQNGSYYGEALVGDGNSLNFPIIGLSQNSSFEILATDPATACAITLDTTLSVQVVNIVAAASVTVSSDFVPLTVDVNAGLSDATIYEWFLDGNKFGEGQQSQVIIETPGEHKIVLSVSSGAPAYCTDSDTVIITQEIINVVIEVPSSFTPNNDNINDYFEIQTLGIQSAEVIIKDPWGVLIKEFDGINEKWNGLKDSGKEVPAGAYYYLVNAQDYSGKTHERHGAVYLIRDLINLTPNPADKSIKVETNGRIPGERTVRVYSSRGERMLEIVTIAGEFEIEISSLLPGIYFMQISNGIDQYTAKFIKQ